VLRIRAAAVYPVTAPPIEDGAVLVDDRGRIAAVGPDAVVPAPPTARRFDFPEAALLPGLVNCHTHLELTHLAGRNAEPAFASWIRRVRELKDGSTYDELVAGAERGVREAWARGVTCVADTGSSGAPMEALARLGGRGVCYQEVFGPDPARVEVSMAELDAQLSRLRPLATSQLRVGISPHAPYTVSEPLYRGVVDYAARERLPLASHLAESREETALVHDGAGPFADALRARGIAVEPRGCSPVEYVERLGLFASSPLCIHCVQVDAADVRRLATAGVAIAHCPRSNRAHAHGTAPLAALRAAGLRVGLGTDSVVSVADPDLWAEAEAAGLGFDDALRMLTLEGARALGWEDEVGSLEAGKAGDLAVLASPALARPRPPSAALLTLVGGRVVWEAGEGRHDLLGGEGVGT
jgi:5-methylthioadenosine/S-adenosylhomocysteine deaminase